MPERLHFVAFDLPYNYPWNITPAVSSSVVGVREIPNAIRRIPPIWVSGSNLFIRGSVQLFKISTDMPALQRPNQFPAYRGRCRSETVVTPTNNDPIRISNVSERFRCPELLRDNECFRPVLSGRSFLDVFNARGNRGRPGSDCRADTFSDALETCKCAGRVRG